ncbi:GNAT family N-acetyltransferase [Acetobacteraceae bacterium KSS8]|uniref:GNAT family N-acetyltransferase n=1 Tax=Endosaccharibacter trunci TaxID=2812733 RepID=A0ABT1WA14_9PROT|nr:GNAT family N-acetyltransferase [Acetobacteraceae bacterium KSS8]
MTLHLAHEVLRIWRQAGEPDLPAIDRLAGLIHPDYPERPEVFANRLALHPSGVRLAELDGAPVGYAIGHPWRGEPPLLDRVLPALPDAPEHYWLHDLALLPEVRGRKLGRAALLLLRGDALGLGLRRMRLAAVGNALPYWETAGFRPIDDALPQCYGAGATAMQWDG